MEDSPGGSGSPVIGPELALTANDIIVEQPNLPVYPQIPQRVWNDLIKAGRNCTIKLRAKDDFDAVVARFGHDNPMNWKIVHEPSLGHHTMVYWNRECC